LRIIRLNELQSQPWKNGGGITREIAALRKNDSIVWRISLAEVVQDGPFSNFINLTRILTVVKGKGLRLKHQGGVINALLYEPVLFDGKLAIHSELIDGPIADLNVIFDSNLCCASASVFSRSTRLGAGRTTVIIGLCGSTRIGGTDDLQYGDTALVDNETVEIKFSENAAALMVSLDLFNQ
jgi:uncharacterized protein